MRLKRVHVFISGNVQGVGFRYFTKRNARSLGVNGWVKNLPDGRVEAVFEGRDEDIGEMISRVKNGPTSSYVRDTEFTEEEIPEREFEDFDVRY